MAWSKLSCTLSLGCTYPNTFTLLPREYVPPTACSQTVSGSGSPLQSVSGLGTGSGLGPGSGPEARPGSELGSGLGLSLRLKRIWMHICQTS